MNKMHLLIMRKRGEKRTNARKKVKKQDKLIELKLNNI